MKNSVFGFDTPEDSPGLLLWQTTVTWQRLIKRALEPYKISHAQFVILAITLWFESKNQGILQNTIICQSKLDKMTVSKSCKKLAAEGYINRMEHKEDTRSKSITLTKKGKKLASKLVLMVENIDKEFFGILKKSDHHFFITILNNLVANDDIRE